jgi:hypothetical protein
MSTTFFGSTAELKSLICKTGTLLLDPHLQPYNFCYILNFPIDCKQKGEEIQNSLTLHFPFITLCEIS